MKLSTNLLSVAMMTAVSVVAFAQLPSAIKYPVAHKDNTVDTYFGTKVKAPHQWMENLTDPALQGDLRAVIEPTFLSETK